MHLHVIDSAHGSLTFQMYWKILFCSYSFCFHLFSSIEIHRSTSKGGLEGEKGFGVSWLNDVTLEVKGDYF